MKDFTINLPYTPYVDLVVIADLHIGDPLVNMEAVTHRIRQCMKPGVYAILNGDLINNATKNSVSDVYSERMSPQEAIDKVVELLEPLAKQGKILLIDDGNHERRTYKMDGLSPTWVIAQRLGLTNRLTDTSAVLHINLGKQQYAVYVTHGSGGGRMISGKMLKLDRLADICDADVYIMSHVHQPGVFTRAYYRMKGGKSVKTEKIFILTAATLDYGGYADSAGMQPAATTNPVLTLFGGQKFASVLAGAKMR